MNLDRPGASHPDRAAQPTAREFTPSASATLPRSRAPFVGRAQETRVILQLLRDPRVRLLTVVGPGGAGKSRLTEHAVHRLAGNHLSAGEVTWVSLASIADPADVLSAIAAAVGVRDGGTRSPVESIGIALQARAALIVLDTFEHVLPASMHLAELLAACPSLRFVVTSRTPLRLAGEQLYRVPPLALPPRELSGGARAGKSDAVRFFVTCATAFDPEFVLATENEAIVAEICRRVDGLPLAIELAAARLSLFTPAELLNRLERRLPLLVDGARDAPDRHRSLRDSIDWSYALLPDPDQRLFRWLALFPGGFVLESAERIGETLGETAVLPVVARLLDANLLTAGEQAGTTRLGMLDTVREYGLERLGAAGELTEASAAQAETTRAFVLGAEPHLSPSAELPVWLKLVDGELDNIRTALHWFEAHDAASFAQLAGALAQFWLRRSMLRESRQWSERVLAHPSLPPALRARPLIDLARTMTYQFDFSQPDIVRAGFAAAVEAGNLPAQVDALMVQVTNALIRGDPDVAQETLVLAREKAASLPGSAHDARRATLVVLEGMLLARYGSLARAIEVTDAALAQGLAADDSMHVAFLHWSRHQIPYRQGNPAAAVRSLQSALAIYRSVGERWSIATITAELAVVVAPLEPSLAAVLSGYAERVFALLGLAWPFAASETFLAMRSKAAADIGLERWEYERQRGLQLTFGEGVDLALGIELVADSVVAALPVVVEHPLTRREREVLRLIVAGRTDRQIALELGISYRTTTTYVTAILKKLSVPSRAAAAAWAVRHDPESVSQESLLR